MPWTLESRDWKSPHAVLLVHGIGNTAVGGGAEIRAAVQAALKTDSDTTALYQLYYDDINDWLAQKTKLAQLLVPLVNFVKHKAGNDDLAATIGDYAGDVIWPVLSTSARSAIREAYLAQLKKLVQDGVRSGYPAARQQITIICHSLGCFHTYETLQEAARNPAHALQPATHEVRFKNVIYMASPAQLIRTAAGDISAGVPDPSSLAVMRGTALTIPSETALDGTVVKSVDNWVSICGDLDPVGGFFFRKKQDWAYMTVAGQKSVIDKESATNVNSAADLKAVLAASVKAGTISGVNVNDPHSWTDYVNRHADDLRTWVTA